MQSFPVSNASAPVVNTQASYTFNALESIKARCEFHLFFQ